MDYKIEGFFTGEDGNRSLKKEYTFSYSYFPGFYGKLCRVKLFVRENDTFQLYFFFHEKNMPEFEKTSKAERIHYYQESKLPFEIRKALSQILNADFKLNDSYYNSNETYGVLDRTMISTAINHGQNNFSIDLSPDTLDRKLFRTQSEIDFLKLIELTEKWLDHLSDVMLEIYTVE